jgi:hypothetical protein
LLTCIIKVVEFPNRPVLEVPYASSGVVVVCVVWLELLELLADPLEPLPELPEPPELLPDPPDPLPEEPLPPDPLPLPLDPLPDVPEPLVPEPEESVPVVAAGGRYITDRTSSSIRRSRARAKSARSTSTCPADE